MTQAAYQPRIPIYPRSVRGRFRTIKYVVLALAYGVYFLLPWLRWARESAPDQAVLFDLAGRRFYLFDLVVYAQDIFWLAGLLVIFALLLFFVTGVAGRVFCGYFCFQTLWTDVYILIERLVQGERNARIKLANAPWSTGKFFKLGLTHVLWLTTAFVTGLTFVLYWGNAPQLVLEFFRGEAPFAAYATTLFLTATTYVMAGLAREQVCTYMCPYARFQGVMFDRDTLIVAYDEQRGEREQGRHKPSREYMEREARIADKVGDCIDCGYCVQVCPVGIDIRNGLQYQCISCALCIDACDTIMDSIDYPRGLIRYTSQKALEGGKNNPFNLKNLGYALVLIAAIGLLVWGVSHRDRVELSVAQFRQPLSVTLSDGRVQNRYEIKINNKTSQAVRYRISIDGLPRAELDLAGNKEVTVSSEHSLKLIAKVNRRPEVAIRERQPFEFVIHQLDSDQPLTSRRSTTFYTPQTDSGPIVMTDILLTLLGGVVVITLGFLLLYRFSRLDGKMVAVVTALLVVGITMPVVIVNWPGADVFAIHIALYLVTVYVLGIISSQRDARRAGGESDRWFHWGPATIVIFFMVVIAVNSVYILMAQKGLDSKVANWLLPEPRGGGQISSHFPGTVARDFRKQRDEFNQFQQRIKAQQERDWQVQKGWLGEARAGEPSRFKLRVTDRDGAPIHDAQVSGVFLRPGDSRLDQAFAMQAQRGEPGSYRVELVMPEAGRWELLLQVRQDEQIHEIKATTRVEAAR